MCFGKRSEKKEKQEETTYNSRKVVETAKSLIKHAEIGEKHNIKLGDIASFLSLIAVVATIALFQRNVGYCRAYNIPAEAIPLDLESYIPICVSVLGVGYYLLLYFAEMKIDIIYQINRINLFRIFWGAVLLLEILISNNIGKYLGPLFCIIFSLSVPTIIELVLLLRRKGIKERIYTEIEYRTRVYNLIHNHIMYKYGIKSGLIYIIIVVAFFPLLGELSARARTNYQICIYHNKTQAVIVENDDKYLIQEATIIDKNLTIFTDTYRYIGKQDIVLENQTFETVTFQKEREESTINYFFVEHDDNLERLISNNRKHRSFERK